jgi:hypothetical protein
VAGWVEGWVGRDCDRVESIVSGQPDCTSANSFGPREQTKLVHILSMLSSPFEHERAAAGLLASVFLTKHGLAWSDVVSSRPETAAEAEMAELKRNRRRSRRDSNRQWRGYCRRRRFSVSQIVNLLA